MEKSCAKATSALIDMPGFTTLVTASQWTPEAESIVQAAGGQIAYVDGALTEDLLIERLTATGAQALVLRGSPPVTARVLAAAPALKIVAKNGAGVDSVDIPEATRRGIAVAVAAGANAYAVAEHALAMMLALVRGLPQLDRKLRDGGWEGASYRGRDFRGCTVGLVGYGAIGRHTAQLATALGARVCVLRRSGPADGFETERDLARLLPRVDVLSLHCPLTEATRGLIGAAELAALKPGAVLVNTARGAVVDETALLDALRSGHLPGAGLDTFATEPLPADSGLRALPNVILTPHVAGVTRDAALRVATLTASNVVDHLAGRALVPGHRIN